MKCPLCSATFTVPSLPAAPPPIPLAPPPLSAPPRPETFTPPKPPSGPAGSGLSSAAAPPAPPAAPPPGYNKFASVPLDPRVLRWTPAVLLVITFILTFFSWVGAYPGGYGDYTQNPWGAIGKAYSADPVGEGIFHLAPEIDGEIGPGILLVFYILLLVFAVGLAVVSLVVMLVPLQLPPAVQPVMPWRFLITAGVTLLSFLILMLQLLWGMPLANAIQSVVDKQKENARAALAKDQNSPVTSEQDIKLNTIYGSKLDGYNVRLTRSLRLAVLLQLVAIIAAVAMYWLEGRGSRPLPRIDILT